jgi:hypothetical protein
MTLEEAIQMGLKPFVDDRHFCVDCAMHKPNAYMGKCHKNIVQYPLILNRCNSFTQKVLQSQKIAAPNTEEKPFWEI